MSLGHEQQQRHLRRQDRLRQELLRSRARAGCLSPWIPLSVRTRPAAAPRTRNRPRRWNILSRTRSAGEAACPRPRRPAHRAAQRRGTTRPSRNPRRPLRPIVNRDHEPTSDRQVACCPGRPHRRRCHLRPRRPQRSRHQPHRPVRPQTQRSQDQNLNPRHSHGRFAPGLAQVLRSACPSVRTRCPSAPEYATTRCPARCSCS